MELLLVRHAENVLPDNNTQLDANLIARAGLTSNGHIQATQLAKHLQSLPNVQSVRLLSSPAERCILTATQIGEAIGVKFDLTSQLSDRSLGDILFASIQEYRNWQLNAWVDLKNAEMGSESLVDMKQRVESWLREVMKTEVERIIVVTHGSIIEQVTSSLLGIPLERMANSFLQCDHGNYHQWHLSNSAESVVLIRANVASSVKGSQLNDAYATMSERIGATIGTTFQVVEKYYVR